MESITIEITLAKLQDAVQKNVEDVLKSGYNNPLRKAIENALNEKQGIFKTFVDDLITETLMNPEFKTQLGSIMMQEMVKSAMRK